MDKIVNIYGEPAERGGYEIKDVEKIKLFNLDMIEIMNQEDEIDVNIIPVEELETASILIPVRNKQGQITGREQGSFTMNFMELYEDVFFPKEEKKKEPKNVNGTLKSVAKEDVDVKQTS